MSTAEIIRWFGPETGDREQELVLEVLRSNYLNDGAVTRRFEERIAGLIGVRHCVGVTSGTAAITLALMAAGIEPGDEVLVPDLTFIATANAVRLAGGIVKLVDVEPHRLSLDLESVAKAISSRTRAVVPVDVNGRGVDYEALEALAAQHGLFIICDSAEALGSKYRGRFLGTFGKAGCFSFSANKTVTTGQGGMVATNDLALYHRLIELKDQGRAVQGTGGDDLHPVIGYNFKLTNLQAAVGLAQLEKLERRLAKARLRESWYQAGLADCHGIELLPADTREGEILQWTDALIDDRGRVGQALKEAGIGFRPFWHPLHSQKPYAGSSHAFPMATSASARGLWLPSSFDLTEAQVAKVCAVIREALAAALPAR